MLAATSMRPLGSMPKVRSCTPRPSIFWISVGSPVVWSMAKTATLFSPPAHFLAAGSASGKGAVGQIDEFAVGMNMDRAGALRHGRLADRTASL